MSYAQRHRNRLEVHQTIFPSGPDSTASTPRAPVTTQKTAAALSGPAIEQQQSQRQQSSIVGGDAPPQRTSSSLLRANAPRLQQGHSSGIDIAAWSGAASNAGASERQPFHLLQRTPPKNEPPRLKASRKQFASPHVQAAAAGASASEGSASVPLSLPIVVNHDSPVASSRHETLPDPRATDLRIGTVAAVATAAAAAEKVEDGYDDEDDDDGGGVLSSRAHIDPHSDALAAGETSPSPIPVSHQASQPAVPFVDSSSIPSSARLSVSQWPASETFTARLKNIMDTRQQIEALVRKQREDEAEMVHAIAALDEQSAQHQQQHNQPSSPDSASPHRDGVRRHVYEQVVMERDAAFAALREFKEKGNTIVYHLYDTVKSQQEQTLELVATVEALKKANKRLKDALSSNSNSASGGGGGRDAVPAAAATTTCGTIGQLQQKVETQRRVIEQMDQLMQNADRMLLAMRARVEAAERKAAAATAPPLDRRQLPPLPKGSVRPGSAAGGGEAPLLTAAAAATPDAVNALERLVERYPADHDLAIVSVQQQLLLDRIGHLRQSLKQEEAQRLHLEEVYGATSEETARNVALLEERLQRAENPRGVPYSSNNAGGPSANATAAALRDELHTLLEQEDAEGGRPPTPSNASSPTSSRSSTPTRTLFTAVSVGDVATTTAANKVAEKRAAATQAAEEREEEQLYAEEEEGKEERRSSAAIGASAPAAVEEAEEETPADGAEAHTPTTPPAPDQADAEKAKEVAGTGPQSPAPKPQDGDELQPGQPRAYLSRQRSGGRYKGDAAAVAAAAAAAAHKAPLGIPVPETSSLGNSLRRSFNSRSSSASRRLVEFRPAGATNLDATSRGLESDEDVDVDVDMDAEPGEAAAAPVHDEEQHNGNSGSTNNNINNSSSSDRASGITGVTPTITPTAIHSASSPLPDTSTSAEMSAKRQQRLHKQMEELDKLEADVTNVVRSLDVV